MAQGESSSDARDDTRFSLVCEVGGRRCAMALRHVVETLRPLPIRSLAGAPDFVMGVTTIRGAVMPVVHLGRLLGDTGVACGRFVVARAGERHVALAVDGITGVRALPHECIRELPPLLRDVATVAAIGTLDADVLFLLQTARLVPDTTWASFDAREANA
jgi:purine-binding chemotaxis protein CheW